MCHANDLILNTATTNNEILNLMKHNYIVNGSLLSEEQIDRLKSDLYKRVRGGGLND